MNSAEQFALDKQLQQLEEKFDSVIIGGSLNESVSVMLNEAFDSTQYPLKELQIKGSEVNYIFSDDKGEDYRLQFIGAGGSLGKNTDTVYIGKRRGNSKVFVDTIDKINDPARMISSMIAFLNDYLLNKGKSKVGFGISLSGKVGVRFAPFLKKLIDRTLRSKLKVVKGNYDPIKGRKFVWAYDSTKTPEEVFNGKKITDEAPWMKKPDVEDKATETSKKPENKKPQTGSDMGATYLEIKKALQVELKLLRFTSSLSVEIMSHVPKDNSSNIFKIQVDFGSGVKQIFDLNVSKVGTIEYIFELRDVAEKISSESKRIITLAKKQKELVGKVPEDKAGHTATGVKTTPIEQPANGIKNLAKKVVEDSFVNFANLIRVEGTSGNAKVSNYEGFDTAMKLQSWAARSSIPNFLESLKTMIPFAYEQAGFVVTPHNENNFKVTFGNETGYVGYKVNGKTTLIGYSTNPIDKSTKTTDSKMNSKGQVKAGKLSTLPPVIKDLMKFGLKDFKQGASHYSNPDIHNWYFDAVGSTGKIVTDKNDTELVAIALEDKAIKSIDTFITFADSPTLDNDKMLSALFDKNKILISARTSAREIMSLITKTPKRTTNFTKTVKFIETYVKDRLSKENIEAQIVPSGSGENLVSVYIGSKFFHVVMNYPIKGKLTTQIRSNNPMVELIHPDKIYDSLDKAHEEVFVKSIDKLIDVIKNGVEKEVEKPDISENYSIEQAVESKDPSILGAKGLWMRGVLLNESIEDVGHTFRWGMPKTGELKTFVSKGFVRKGKSLSAETAQGEAVIFKVVGVDPKVTPKGFVSNTNEVMVGDSDEEVKNASLLPNTIERSDFIKIGTSLKTFPNDVVKPLRDIGIVRTYNDGYKQKLFTVTESVNSKEVLDILSGKDLEILEFTSKKIVPHARYDNVFDGMEKEEIGKNGYIPKKLIDTLKLGEEFEWFGFYSGWDHIYKVVKKQQSSVVLEKINTGQLFSYVTTEIDYDIMEVERAILKISQTDSNGNKHFIYYNPNNGRIWMNNSSGTNFSVSNLMFMRHDVNGTAEQKQVFIEGVQVADPSTKNEFVAVVRELTRLGNQIQPF